MALWLGIVMLLTGIAGVRGKLPGVEPAPYIIRFTEDRPNPLYRRVCYTFAWSAAITFAILNIAGLVVAIATGQWYLKQIYRYAYFPIAGTIWLLGAAGRLPRVMASTKGEGHERRYFYGTVWAMCIAQPSLWLMWYVCRTRWPETAEAANSFRSRVRRHRAVGTIARRDRSCRATACRLSPESRVQSHGQKLAGLGRLRDFYDFEKRDAHRRDVKFWQAMASAPTAHLEPDAGRGRDHSRGAARAPRYRIDRSSEISAHRAEAITPRRDRSRSRVRRGDIRFLSSIGGAALRSRHGTLRNPSVARPHPT